MFRSYNMKSFIAKRLNSILVNLRYLRFKLLKYKENNKKICNTFDHNFKNIPLYIMRKVSLERYYFVLYDCALTSKMSKWRLSRFAIKLFIYSAYHIQMASLCARGINTPALALMQPFSAKSIQRNKFLLGTHLLLLGRERQMWAKCLV